MSALWAAWGMSILLSTPLEGAAQSASPVVEPAAVPYSEQFVLKSKVLGRDMLIQVAKPSSPFDGKASVIYFLDGNYSFPSVAGTAYMTPPGRATFVVGIGYADTTIAKWIADRFVDLVHVEGVDNPGLPPNLHTGGGGATFERFIESELRPAIEARYPVDRARSTLAGYSLGGLYVAHILVNSPQAYQHYIIGDPTCLAEQGLIEKAKRLRGRPGQRVVIATAGLNPAPHRDCIDLLGAALARPETGLAVLRWTGAEEDHGSFSPAFYSRALRHVMQPPAAK